jgi:hypothetical protein
LQRKLFPLPLVGVEQIATDFLPRTVEDDELDFDPRTLQPRNPSPHMDGLPKASPKEKAAAGPKRAGGVSSQHTALPTEALEDAIDLPDDQPAQPPLYGEDGREEGDAHAMPSFTAGGL